MSVSQTLYKSFYWKLLQFGVSFIATVLIARMLQPAGTAKLYGLLYRFMLAAAIFTAGLDISINYFIARSLISVRKALGIIGIVVVVANLICVLFSGIFSDVNAIPLRDIMALTALFLTGSLLTILCGSVMTALGANYRATKVTVSGSLVTLAALVSVWGYRGADAPLNWVIWIWCAGSAATGAIMLLSAYRRRHTQLVAREPVGVSNMFAFSLKAFIVNIIFFAAIRLPVLLLPGFATLREQGNFVQCFRLLEYFNSAVAFLYFPMVAIAAAHHERRSVAALTALIRIFNLIASLVCILAVVSGRWLFPVLFGNGFGEAYAIFLILIPAFLVTPISSFATAQFFGAGKLHANAVSATVFFLVVGLIFAALILKFGTMGAAVALTAGCLSSSVVDVYYLHRSYGVKFRQLTLPGREDWRVLRSILIRSM